MLRKLYRHHQLKQRANIGRAYPPEERSKRVKAAAKKAWITRRIVWAGGRSDNKFFKNRFIPESLNYQQIWL